LRTTGTSVYRPAQTMSAVAGRLPPRPHIPRLAAAVLVFTNNRWFLRRVQRRHGDAFRIVLPAIGPAVVVSSPELVKQMFTASNELLLGGEGNPLSPILGPGSLFSLDRGEHLRERRLLLPPFHGDRMKSYESIIEEEARREFASWENGVEFATMPSFMRITLNAILRAVFGAEGPRMRQLADVLPGIVDLGSKLSMAPWLLRDLGPLSPGGKFRRRRRIYDALIGELIDDALADSALDERVDVLALLLRAHYDDGAAMTRAAIADELLTLLAAGHETTATSLAWAVERLRRHPWILTRLVEEARNTNGSQLRIATIHEIQRTRPVIVATGRLAKDDFQLGEYLVPGGHRVIASASMIHNDARFFERPAEFQPDRFVNRKPDTYTWIPFGGGTRRCIGAAFAHMEMDVVLRALLREFDLQTTDAPGERWRSRGVAFAPARGGRAVVRRR
jgi:hypothetical protein